MLNKLRSRAGIDLPVERWKRTWLFSGIVGFLALAFVILPVAGALGYAFVGGDLTLVEAAGGLVLAVGFALATLLAIAVLLRSYRQAN